MASQPQAVHSVLTKASKRRVEHATMPALLVDHAKRLKDKDFQNTLERERAMQRRRERAHNISQSLLHLGTANNSYLRGLDPLYVARRQRQLTGIRQQVASLQN
jgi:hypothetical protein